jgi:heme exporter protein D
MGEHRMTYKDDLLGGRGAASSPTEDLVLAAKDLLEICRVKCSPTDEVWRADGVSNERVMIAAIKAIHEAEHMLAKARADKAREDRAKAAQFLVGGDLITSLGLPQ